MSCISANDPQLTRLADAIAQRVGQQRFHVWFNNSTRMDLKHDGLEIAVPNDFISEWIGTHFTRPIQEAAAEVLGGPLQVRFSVMPQLFALDASDTASNNGANGDGGGSRRVNGNGLNGHGNNGHNLGGVSRKVPLPHPAETRLGGPTSGRSPRFAHSASDNNHDLDGGNGGGTALLTKPVTVLRHTLPMPTTPAPRPAHRHERDNSSSPAPLSSRPRLRHDIDTFVVGASNQLAYNTALYVAEFPGAQYNPLFIHGNCGLGKTHLLQGLCKRFIDHHPTKRWLYLTGEEFTNEFLTSLRANKIDVFRRKMRDLDLLVIDDVHFLSGKKATQEEFLHTFNAIEAMGRQVVMASDNHPKMIDEFGESLINRFVSGMVVRMDPPNFAMRCQILRALSDRGRLGLSEEVIGWIARRVTQNVRELEGALTRVAAHVTLTGSVPNVEMAQAALGDLDRQLIAPVKPENVLTAVCSHFGLEHKDLMSGRRQRTVSLARSVAMYLVRKTAKLSFPEIGIRMGKRNHSTVISACRRIERAVGRNETLAWNSSVGEREEEASELVQRLEEYARAMA